jgi:hypothetical protein
MIGGRVMLVCGGFVGDFVALGGIDVSITGGDVTVGGVQGACVEVGGLTLVVVVAVVGDVVVAGIVGTTAPVGLIGCRDTSRAAEISMAVAATTMAPRAIPASAALYHRSRDCSCAITEAW